MKSTVVLTTGVAGTGKTYRRAVVESFFGSLKNEWVQKKIYETLEDAKKDIFSHNAPFPWIFKAHKDWLI